MSNLNLILKYFQPILTTTIEEIKLINFEKLIYRHITTNILKTRAHKHYKKFGIKITAIHS